MAANRRAEALAPRFEQEPAPEPQALLPSPEPGDPEIYMDAPAVGEPPSDIDSLDAVAPGDNGDSRHEAIARAAYCLAEARGFEPEHELDDWLAAERQAGLP